MAADGSIKLFNADRDNPVSMHRRPAGGRRRNSRLRCGSGFGDVTVNGEVVAAVDWLF